VADATLPKSADAGAALTAETASPSEPSEETTDTAADSQSQAADAPPMAAMDAEKETAPADPITPTETTAEASATSPAPMFPAVRVAVQAELERGELAQALLRLSDWYGDPSLTPAEQQEVETLLSQLAGSVIWEGPPAHRLEPAHVVQAGETLEDIGAKYDVPWQLLGKINGVADPKALQPGQQLKVLRGKFSAIVDLSERAMTLFLDRRYAGKFAVELDPTTAIEEGQWKVDQKLLTPAGGGVYGGASGTTEDRSLLLANAADPAAPAAVLRGPGSSDPASPQPDGRVIRLKSTDVNDVYDILSVGSKVTIRR
jgi:LysM repeat protein